MAQDITSQESWASALLTDLGDIPTPTSESDIVAWENAEGGAGPQFGIPNNITDYNPINTTQVEPGSRNTPGNNPPVQAYTSWDEGLQATVTTLNNGYYPGIVDALKNGDTSLPLFESIVGGTKWGTWQSPSSRASGGDPTSKSATGTTSTDAGAGVGPNATATSISSQNHNGFAGVLQTLDGWMNPTMGGGNIFQSVLDVLNGTDVAHALILVATRAVFSTIFTGMAIVAIPTMMKGSSKGGGSNPISGTTNVLEFVNNAKLQSGRQALQGQRIQSQIEKEGHINRRHEASMSAKQEERKQREADRATRTSIFGASNAEKAAAREAANARTKMREAGATARAQTKAESKTADRAHGREKESGRQKRFDTEASMRATGSWFKVY